MRAMKVHGMRHSSNQSASAGGSPASGLARIFATALRGAAHLKPSRTPDGKQLLIGNTLIMHVFT
jgi:hypothetical protein